MSKTTERAEKLLKTIEAGLPFRINKASASGEEPMLATIRTDGGNPVIAPHPEAISMLQARSEVFTFIVEAPEVIRGLLDQIASYEAANSVSKPSRVADIN